MEIYLSHLGRKIDSPYYRELLRNPPDGVRYITDVRKTDILIKEKKFDFLESIGKKIIEIFKIPPVKPIEKNVDLIHAAHHLVYTKKPWVVDFEHVISLAGMNSDIANSFLSKKILKKFLLSKSCKKILPWTNVAKKSLFSLLNKDFEKKAKEKVEVLYPAIKLPEFKKISKDKITLLFVSRYFYRKGGLEATLSFYEVAKKYDVDTIIISNVPKKIKEKYSKYVKFYKPVTREMLMKHFYPSADIFVYPTFYDTFGFPIIEAMSFGLPVISLDDFSARELIINGKTGFIIKGYREKWYMENCLHNPENNPIERLIKKIKNSHKERERIVKDIVEKICLLIEDDNLRKYMSKNAREEVEKGRFSIKRRNKRLKEIYEEACKS